MADDVQDIYIATEAGDAGWQSLTELTASKVDAKLPIESEDGTIVLSDSSGHFVVNTGNGGQIRLEPGNGSNNYFRLYDTGSGNGAMLCSRNSVSNAFVVRPFKENVTGNYYTANSILWDYTAGTVEFTNATNDFILAGYSSPSPACKGDRYFGFNVGGLGPTTDFTLAAGLHVNVLDNPAADKDAYSILVSGTAPSYFNSNVQAPSVSGLADDDASVTLGGSFEVSTGGVAIATYKKGTSNPVYITPRPDANGFKGVRYRTYAGAASGSSVVAALSVNDGIDATLLNTFSSEPAVVNGSATIQELRGYYAEDGGGTCETYIAFYSDVKDRRNEANPDDRCDTWFVYGLSDAPSYFGGNIQTPSISGLADTDASVSLGGQATLKAGDGSEYVPSGAASISTKKYCDDKIWVGTSAEYAAISPKLPETLYCLTD